MERSPSVLVIQEDRANHFATLATFFRAGIDDVKLVTCLAEAAEASRLRPRDIVVIDSERNPAVTEALNQACPGARIINLATDRLLRSHLLLQSIGNLPPAARQRSGGFRPHSTRDGHDVAS